MKTHNCPDPAEPLSDKTVEMLSRLVKAGSKRWTKVGQPHYDGRRVTAAWRRKLVELKEVDGEEFTRITKTGIKRLQAERTKRAAAGVGLHPLR